MIPQDVLTAGTFDEQIAAILSIPDLTKDQAATFLGLMEDDECVNALPSWMQQAAKELRNRLRPASAEQSGVAHVRPISSRPPPTLKTGELPDRVAS